MRGRTSFQKKNRMMTKQIAEAMMSGHAGISGLCVSSVAAITTLLSIVPPYGVG